jgi:hypothetical protein
MSRTLRSAALALLALGPITAAAQTPPLPYPLLFGANTTRDTLISLTECNGTGTRTNVQLTGAIATDSGVTYSTGGSYKVYASNTAPKQIATSGPWYCPTADDTNTKAGQVGGIVTATNSTATTGGSISPAILVNLSEIVAKSGNSACSADASPIWVCVHWFDASGNQHGSAWGAVTLQLIAPGKPTNVTILGPGDSSLQVSWTAPPSTGGPADPFHYHIVADATGTGDPSPHHETGDLTGTSGPISGLVNDVTYNVTVVAFSAGGNRGDPSDPAVPGTPKATSSFWGYYQAQGGREQGGCATAGGGLLALAGAALALRRRRS